MNPSPPVIRIRLPWNAETSGAIHISLSGNMLEQIHHNMRWYRLLRQIGFVFSNRLTAVDLSSIKAKVTSTTTTPRAQRTSTERGRRSGFYPSSFFGGMLP